VNTFLLIDITPTVQNWLTNPSSNNGVALALIGTAGYFSFESKEGVFTSHEPELEIVLNSTSNTGLGTVTSVGSGLGLTGGPITTTGTLNIDPSIVPQLGALKNVFTGNIAALSFTGNGAGLTNVNAATLNGVAGYNVPSLTASNNFLGNQTITGNLNIAGIGSTLTVGGPSIFNMDVTSGAAVTSNCLASAGTTCTGFQFNGLSGNNIFNAQINGTTELNVDAGGNMTLNGGVTTAGATLPALGTATSASAFNSNALNLVGSSFNGSSAVPEQVALVFEPLNNSGSPSGSLNLLFGQGAGPLTETGFSVSTGGVVNFVPGQTFGTTTITANNALSAANAASSAAANAATAAASAVPAAETYANSMFVPLAGGTMTGTLNVPTLSSPLALSIKSPIDINAKSGSSMELSAATSMQLSAATMQLSGAIMQLSASFLDISSSVNLSGPTVNVDALLTTAGLINSGPIINRGPITLQPSSATGASNSSPLILQGNSINSATNSLDSPLFQWQFEPTGNGTSGPPGTLNLLYADSPFGNPTTGQETGLSIAPNGIITFAPGQSFPGGGSGGGTVTSVASGLGLTGGPITASGTLSIATGGVTNAMLATPSVTIVAGTDLTGGGTIALGGTTTLSVNTVSLPQLTGGNSFSGNQSISGSVAASGSVSGAAVTAATVTATGGFYLGFAKPFAYSPSGSSYSSVFLGYAGQSINQNFGNNNTAIGFQALNVNGTGSSGGFASSSNTAVGTYSLFDNTTGSSNVANGTSALHGNTTGSNNTGSGGSALYNNSTGSNNTGSGNSALYYNSTGSNNTALGYNAGPDSTTPTLNNATAIGAFADVEQPNSLVLGSIANVNGCNPTDTPACQSASVGIGTSTPQATLDVESPSGTPLPTVIFGGVSNPATFTVNGTTNIVGSLNVNGLQVTGGGSSGGGTITGVTAGTGLKGGGTSGNVILNLDTAATNTFTGTQSFNVVTGNGIVASTSSNSNAGISGSNDSSLGGGAGVAGFTISGAGSGVVGTNSSSSLGGGYGVQGLSYNAADPGVGGINNAPSGSGFGVSGQSLSSTGTGVYGTGAGTGVTGSSSSSTGTGVYGTATGTGIGVTGTSPVQGVFGVASATAGTTSGVLGQSYSPNGTGVTGLNSGGGSGVSGQGYTGVDGMGPGSGVTGTSTSASGSGVVGIENSGGGYAGFFQGDVAVTGNLSNGGNVAVTGNATVAGTLAIGGDTAMSHSPRMTFSGTVASFTTSPQAAGYFIPDQPIVITRFTVAVGYGQTPYICNTTTESMSLTINGNASAAKVFAPVGGVFYDSHALNIPVNAGTPIYMYGNSASGDPGCQSGNNITATVEYAMQ
jgi:hypothetical protein